MNEGGEGDFLLQIDEEDLMTLNQENSQFLNNLQFLSSNTQLETPKHQADYSSITFPHMIEQGSFLFISLI